MRDSDDEYSPEQEAEAFIERATETAETAIGLFEQGYVFDPEVDMADRLGTAVSEFNTYLSLLAEQNVELPERLRSAREFLVPRYFLKKISLGGTISEDAYDKVTVPADFIGTFSEFLRAKNFPVPTHQDSVINFVMEIQDGEYFDRLTEEQKKGFFEVFKEAREVLTPHFYDNYLLMKQREE